MKGGTPIKTGDIRGKKGVKRREKAKHEEICT